MTFTVRHFPYKLRSVAINVRFQHLPNANNEILKAFNSNTAAKALEAYQPLDAKNRKREKLKALQILKQNSSSVTLADINLTEGSLAASLSQANGATLQAMLNLLSAKMIEQNKYTIFERAKESEEHKDKLIRRVQEKSQEEDSESSNESDKEDQNEDDEKTIEEQKQKANQELVKALLNSVKLHLDQIKEDILRAYNNVLDVFSLKRLRAALDESIKSIKKYIFEQPAEYIDEKLINPIINLPQKMKDYVDTNISQFKQSKDSSELSFSANEIRDILKKSTSEALNDSLKNSIKVLKSNQVKSKVQSAKPNKNLDAIPVSIKKTKKTSNQELKLVMHQS